VIVFRDKLPAGRYIGVMIRAIAATYFWYFSYPTVPAEAGVRAI